MTRIGIIIGSTRPPRLGPQVAAWAKDLADARGTESYEIVDVKEYALPLYDEALPAAIAGGAFDAPEARAWSEKIASFDGYVFVTPEYNRGVPSSLKNAIDYLGAEFNDKAAGIISYGAAGGQTATAGLRLHLAALQVATVSSQPALSIFTDFTDGTTFAPGPHNIEPVQLLLEQVAAWSNALAALR